MRTGERLPRAQPMRSIYVVTPFRFGGGPACKTLPATLPRQRESSAQRSGRIADYVTASGVGEPIAGFPDGPGHASRPGRDPDHVGEDSVVMNHLDRFLRSYGPKDEERTGRGPWLDPRLADQDDYLDIAHRLAGSSVGGGLYRFHDEQSGPAAKSWIDGAFPRFTGRAVPFASDWLGRQFAVDLARGEVSRRHLLLMDAGANEVLEIPVGLAEFHNVELVDFADAAVAAGFFAQWQARTTASVAFSQCVGYRVPLFLGGIDDVNNLESIDTGLYWAVCAQLIAGTLDLPAGATIANVRIHQA